MLIFSLIHSCSNIQQFNWIIYFLNSWNYRWLAIVSDSEWIGFFISGTISLWWSCTVTIKQIVLFLHRSKWQPPNHFCFFFCFLHNEFIAIIWCTNVTVANVNNYFFQAALRFISVISIVWLPPWMFFFCRNKKHWTKEYKQMLPCSYWVECQSIKNSCVYFCHVWKNCNLYGQ